MEKDLQKIKDPLSPKLKIITFILIIVAVYFGFTAGQETFQWLLHFTENYRSNSAPVVIELSVKFAISILFAFAALYVLARKKRAVKVVCVAIGAVCVYVIALTVIDLLDISEATSRAQRSSGFGRFGSLKTILIVPILIRLALCFYISYRMWLFIKYSEDTQTFLTKGK